MLFVQCSIFEYYISCVFAVNRADLDYSHEHSTDDHVGSGVLS